jgi:hypothetical protein
MGAGSLMATKNSNTASHVEKLIWAASFAHELSVMELLDGRHRSDKDLSEAAFRAGRAVQSFRRLQELGVVEES